MQETVNPFVVCKAAAGSGKTFTLVQEYLKLAMTVDPSARNNTRLFEHQLRTRFASILAITFTNKAADEMKTRIMDSLSQIAQFGTDPSSSDMGAPLLDLLNSQPTYATKPIDEEEFRWMAQTLHSAILHRYTDLAVSTIDSFMHRVVRTFAHDLDKPVDFEVMIDHEELIDQAVRGLVALIGTLGNEALTQLTQAYAASLMQQEESYNFEQALKDLAEQLFHENTAEYIATLSSIPLPDYLQIHAALTARIQGYEASVRAIGTRMIGHLTENGVTASDLPYANSGYYGYLAKVAQGEIVPVSKRTVTAFETGEFVTKNFDPARRDHVETTVAALTPDYEKLVGLLGTEAEIAAPYRDYYTHRQLRRNLFAMALLSKLQEQMALYIQQAGIVPISEFNKLISNIVEQEPAPFIYERLGSRYRHFLIDEFQDTSILQWHNLVPLLENGVASHHQSLVVGDGKQAIYRFREGDVAQFVDLPVVRGMQLHGAALSMPHNYSLIYRQTNYRTLPGIVDFNNHFFSWLIDQEPLCSIPLVQQIYRGTPTPDGHPELWQDMPDDDEKGGSVDIKFVGKDEAEMYEAAMNIVNGLVSEQGYRFGDILILAPRKKQLSECAYYFTNCEEHSFTIPVTSSESFFLARSHAVMAIVEALRLVHNPANRLAAAAMFEHLHALGLTNSLHPEAFLAHEAIPVGKLLCDEMRGLNFVPERLVQLDLYDCCEELIRQLHLGDVDVPYVASLLGHVATFVAHGNLALVDFLQWFDQSASADLGDASHHQLSLPAPEEIDAVRLMTIHAAKGLEAPVVITLFKPLREKEYALWVDTAQEPDFGTRPYANHPYSYITLGGKDPTRFEEQRNDERNMRLVDDLNAFYVALTRPCEKLYIVCPKPTDSPTTGRLDIPLMLKRFLDTGWELPQSNLRKKKSKKKSKASESVSIRTLNFDNWTRRLLIASPTEFTRTPSNAAQKERGNQLHAVMQLVRRPADLDKALANVVRQERLDDQVATALRHMAVQVLQSPLCADFFPTDPAVRILTESDLVDVVTGDVLRPDRVVLYPDRTLLVDYKTGIDMGDEHSLQVQKYCRALRAMQLPNVSGHLLYLAPQVHTRKVE